jgi:hypothetical protein
MFNYIGTRVLTGLSLAALSVGCAATIEEGAFEGWQDDSMIRATNGLPLINGLSLANGLNLANGLSLSNGLTLSNGIHLVNGLATNNGLSLSNGLPVNCAGGKTPGSTCVGVANGMLSNTTGFLKDEPGKTSASYLVRCALRANESVSLKDYTGGLFSMTGQIGLAPGWLTGTCDLNCQETISACLMALTNGEGNHVTIEMRSTIAAIGQGGTFAYQEAAFYGNLFVSPPTAGYCIGKDFQGVQSITGAQILDPIQRACKGWSLLGLSCPYKMAGNCNKGWGSIIPLGKATCTFSGDSATACSTPSGGSTSNYNNGDKKWKNVITTYRSSKTQ